MDGFGENGGNNKKQVQPTFGVSFGLPQPSHGYPINPFNANPIYNPYGPALNSGGINLGLLSVNPLLAVQVTKNDYGEKVVKPFVNLHVTPNEHVVNKLGHLFHEKKEYLLNKHEHFHHYKPYSYEPHYHRPSYPPFGYPAHPPHYISKPPIYSPHYLHYEHGHYRENPQIAHEAPLGNEDYYDDDDDNSYDGSLDHNPHFGSYGFERSANNSANDRGVNYANRYAYSRSLTVPSNPGANRGGQAIRFPEKRKKRELPIDASKMEHIEEVTNPHIKPEIHIYVFSLKYPYLFPASRILRPTANSTMPAKPSVLPSSSPATSI